MDLCIRSTGADFVDFAHQRRLLYQAAAGYWSPIPHSLSFFVPFFLCPSLWSIHLDVFHRVTNDSMALAFFFIQFSFPGWKESCSLDSPVVSCVLGRRAVAQCMEQHRALCAIPTIVFLFFFFLFFHLSTASLLFRTRWLCWSSCSFAKICPTLIRSQTHNGCPFSGSSVAMESIALRPDFLLIRLLSFS